MTWSTVLLVGLGGLVGTLARFGVGRALAAWLSPAHLALLPWGTLAVNVLGCLLAGYVAAIGQRGGWGTGHWQTVLITGICGGFTTFSALMLDVHHLAAANRPLTAVGYVALTVALGLGALYLGLRLGR